MDTQFSHGNLAYRCRHGHSSAHTASMRQARNLYLREDVIVGRIFAQLHTLTSREADVQDQIASLQQQSTAADLARFLRARNITIECLPTGVLLVPDHQKTIIATPLANAPKRYRGIPRQRHQREKSPQGIVHN